MSCQLTPYGEYADPELCGQQCLDNNAVCDGEGGYRPAGGGEEGKPRSTFECYVCDESTGELVPAQNGTTPANGRAADGVCLYTCGSDGARVVAAVAGGGTTWADTLCYKCDANGTTVAVDAGGTGDRSSPDDVCLYTCTVDGTDGTKKELLPGDSDESGKTWNELKCYTCDSTGASVAVPGTTGDRSSADAPCLYTCNGDTKEVVPESSPGGTPLASLVCDANVETNDAYKYSNYSSYVRRNDTCVAAPQLGNGEWAKDAEDAFVRADGEIMYDSLSECMGVETPQNWDVARALGDGTVYVDGRDKGEPVTGDIKYNTLTFNVVLDTVLNGVVGGVTYTNVPLYRLTSQTVNYYCNADKDGVYPPLVEFYAVASGVVGSGVLVPLAYPFEGGVDVQKERFNTSTCGDDDQCKDCLRRENGGSYGAGADVDGWFKFTTTATASGTGNQTTASDTVNDTQQTFWLRRSSSQPGSTNNAPGVDAVPFTPYGMCSTAHECETTFGNVRCATAGESAFTVNSMNMPLQSVCPSMGATIDGGSEVSNVTLPTLWRVMRYTKSSSNKATVGVTSAAANSTHSDLRFTRVNDDFPVLFEFEEENGASVSFAIDKDTNLTSFDVTAWNGGNNSPTVRRTLPGGTSVVPDTFGMYHFYVVLPDNNDNPSPHRYTLYPLGDADSCLCKVCDPDVGARFPDTTDVPDLSRNDTCEQLYQCGGGLPGSVYGCYQKPFQKNPEGGWETEDACSCFYCSDDTGDNTGTGNCRNLGSSPPDSIPPVTFATLNECEGADRMCGWQFGGCGGDDVEYRVDPSGTYCVPETNCDAENSQCFATQLECLTSNSDAVMGLPGTLFTGAWDVKTDGANVVVNFTSAPFVEYINTDGTEGGAWLMFRSSHEYVKVGVRRRHIDGNENEDEVEFYFRGNVFTMEWSRDKQLDFTNFIVVLGGVSLSKHDPGVAVTSLAGLFGGAAC